MASLIREAVDRVGVKPFLGCYQEAPGQFSLADRIEQSRHALTAAELAEILGISRVTVFKQAKAGRIPSFRVGSCVRFDPHKVAKWLRTQ